MKEFAPFVATLRDLDSLVKLGPGAATEAQLASALDGGAQRALRALVDGEKLKQHGAFFTGTRLSRHATALLASSLSPRSVVLDPACGAGDLLLAAAAALPRRRDSGTLIDSWSQRILGRDLLPSFVEAARLRLTLLAKRQDPNCRLADMASSFPNIRTGCGLSDEGSFAQATHVVLNPPFTKVTAPNDVGWARGSVNYAGVFLDSCIGRARAGTRIVAILPDVLRSGWRYRAWRQSVLRRCDLSHVALGDQFDDCADVHVFLLSLVVRSDPKRSTPSANAWRAPRRTRNTLRDMFDLSVGPVVEYRHPHRGDWHPFLNAKVLEPWSTITHIDGRRRFTGRLVSPPFVAVKRTSRPEDQHRAVGSIVATSVPLAVENHVVILRPRDGSLSTCRRLLGVLADKDTTRRLNLTIRCRHLTIDALAQLPWSNE